MLSRYRVILTVIFAVYAFACFEPMFAGSLRIFHDFYIYYYSARAHSLGQDPYSLKEIISFADNTKAPTLSDYSFLYPPMAIYVFEPLLLLSYQDAAMLYLAVKAMMLVGLFALWSSLFLRRFDPVFLWFGLLAFNSPAYIDMHVGNVSIIEQFLLWFGFAALLARRHAVFCALTCTAALFKLTPLVFLGLLFVPSLRPKRPYLMFGATLGIFGLVAIASYLAIPSATAGFAKNLNQSFMLVGSINPTLLSVWEFARQSIRDYTGLVFPAWLPYLLYISAACVVIAFSLRALRASAVDGRNAILFACLTYAVLMPRFPDYAYLIVLLPAYATFSRTTIGASPILIALACFQVANQHIPGAKMFYQIVIQYYPLLLTLLAWWLLARALGVRPEVDPISNNHLV
jgi:Glycosyltransferase family 87